MSIGKRIKEIKSDAKVSSGEMAKIIDIPARTIGSYERNEAQPGVKFLKAMLEHYNVNVNWLITGKGNKYNLTFDNDEKTDEYYKILELMQNNAAKEMVMNFIRVKNGDKNALNTLLQNLNGIKAILD